MHWYRNSRRSGIISHFWPCTGQVRSGVGPVWFGAVRCHPVWSSAVRSG